MVLASQEFGRGKQRALPSGLGDFRERERSDQSLPRAYIAHEQARGRLWSREVGSDGIERGELVGSRGKRQRAQQGARKAPRAARRPGGALFSAPALECEGELGGQKLVEGEPTPRRFARRRIRAYKPMQAPQRLVKGRPAESGGAEPIGKLG